MTTPNIRTIDHTVQLTYEWLDQLTGRLGWDDRQQCFRLLRVTLQTLRDRLPVNEAANLGAQLPILLRGVYYEGWHPARTPVKERDLDAFMAPIAAAFDKSPEINPRQAVHAVFWLLDQRITKGEMEDVRHNLPTKLREFWGHEYPS